MPNPLTTVGRTGLRLMEFVARLRMAGILMLGVLCSVPLHAGEAGTDAGPGSGPAETPHFQEVLRLLRSHLSGVQESDLNEAMVRGLTEGFGSRVRWVADAVTPAAESETGIRRVQVYDLGVGYLGIKGVGKGLAENLAATLSGLRSSNDLTGWVLDLRFADGRDYAEAARSADLFVEAGRPLVRFEDQTITSTGEGEATLPVVVLVNSGTRGAAEALAGALREAGPAVVLGTRSAGEARSMQAFNLEKGGRLLIAGEPVHVGEGLSLEGGLVPDFESSSPADQERLWLEDPYRVPEGEDPSSRPRTARIDEAALVAQHQGLTNPPAAPVSGSETVVAQPSRILRDPSLSRALSLLKGLARVRGGILR